MKPTRAGDGCASWCPELQFWFAPLDGGRVHTRVANLMDPVTQRTPWPGNPGNAKPNSPDKRMGDGSFGDEELQDYIGTYPRTPNGGSDFAWSGVAPFRPDRGSYHQSNIGHVRYDLSGNHDPTGIYGGFGPVPVMSAAQNDLLWAEWLDGQVLAAHGVEVARAHVVQSARRTYLVSERFDRIGPTGRRHVLAIADVHPAFVAGAYTHWAATAAELARQRRITALDAQRVAALLGFGRLIGNTDMHGGNLGLTVALADLAKGRFGLAPVYDMLPMRWKPNPEMGGAADYTPFEPEISPMTRPAWVPAQAFWAQLAGLGQVSAGMRALAAKMANRLAAAG